MKILLPILSVAALTACSSMDSLTGNDAAAEAQRSTDNAASEYCVAQGGAIEIRQTGQGAAGLCTLPDGTVVEQWELYEGAQAAGTDSADIEAAVEVEAEAES